MIHLLEPIFDSLFLKFFLFPYVGPLDLVRGWRDWFALSIFLDSQTHLFTALLVHAPWLIHGCRDQHVNQVDLLGFLFSWLIFFLEVCELTFNPLLSNQDLFMSHFVRLEFCAIG